VTSFPDFDDVEQFGTPEARAAQASGGKAGKGRAAPAVSGRDPDDWGDGGTAVTPDPQPVVTGWGDIGAQPSPPGDEDWGDGPFSGGELVLDDGYAPIAPEPQPAPRGTAPDPQRGRQASGAAQSGDGPQPDSHPGERRGAIDTMRASARPVSNPMPARPAADPADFDDEQRLRTRLDLLETTGIFLEALVERDTLRTATQGAPSRSLEEEMAELDQLMRGPLVAATKALADGIGLDEATRAAMPWLKATAARSAATLMAGGIREGREPLTADMLRRLGEITARACEALDLDAVRVPAGRMRFSDTSIRLSVFEAMAGPLREISRFAFRRRRPELFQEAQEQILTMAQTVSQRLCESNPAAFADEIDDEEPKLALLVSMIRTTASLYEDCHRQEAARIGRRLKAMDPAEKEEFLKRHADGLPMDNVWRDLASRIGLIAGQAAVATAPRPTPEGAAP